MEVIFIYNVEFINYPLEPPTMPNCEKCAFRENGNCIRSKCRKCDFGRNGYFVLNKRYEAGTNEV